MFEILLSKSTWPIIGWVADLLGLIMNGIYYLLDSMSIGNIALAIMIFTVIIYVALTPIQIKQQKTSKVMNAIQPELQAIQKKYKGKRDQASQMKMQEETMALQQKYGVSMTGSCLPLLIQLPLLVSLYQVIYHIPGYITKVGNMFSGLAAQITQVSGYSDIISKFVSDNSIRLSFSTSDALTKTNIVDFLYLLKPSQWTKLGEISQFAAFKPEIAATAADSMRINSFFGINISESPIDAISAAFRNITSGNVSVMVIFALIVGIMIPVLAWFTQWLNYKLMPQQVPVGDSSNTMNTSMKSMNLIMPVFSAVMCLTFSMGIGIYWIIGAVVRSVQQVIINNKIGKIDMDELMERNKEKAQKKAEKRKNYTYNIAQTARTNVKKYDTTKIQDVNYVANAAPDSITAKANMVRAFDERKEAEKRGKRKPAENKAADSSEKEKK